ncbi:MAG: aminotransferase class I/II-fold pyridoxal phosphate-dependent enzyme, partial [bacterium]
MATALIHQNEGGVNNASPLTTPIYETTTFVFDSAAEVREYQEGKSARYLYSRYENPTVVATERTLAAIESAEAAIVLSSGMAATSTALLGLLGAGDEVICASAIYGGTSHLITDLLIRFGVRARFPTLDELRKDPESLFRQGDSARRVFWFESPNNPTLRCLDIAALAEACRRHNVISVIDNTFASPCNQVPLRHGVDLVMHSATKYLNGHSDVTGGVLAGPTRLIEQLRSTRRLLGG